MQGECDCILKLATHPSLPSRTRGIEQLLYTLETTCIDRLYCVAIEKVAQIHTAPLQPQGSRERRFQEESKKNEETNLGYRSNSVQNNFEIIL